MKCQIQWVDKQGNPTPDENEAVAIAHHHKAIWTLPCGGPGNRIVGYSEEINQSFPICQEHLNRAIQENLDMTLKGGGWTFEKLEEGSNHESRMP